MERPDLTTSLSQRRSQYQHPPQQNPHHQFLRSNSIITSKSMATSFSSAPQPQPQPQLPAPIIMSQSYQHSSSVATAPPPPPPPPQSPPPPPLTPTLQPTLISNETESKSLAKRIPYFGMINSLLSVVCYSLASLIVKILTDLHALEILMIRSIFQIMFYFMAILIYRLPFFGTAGHRLDIALRAIFGAIAAITIYMSYRLIPLADASTIQFSAPVFVFILAYFILGETITLTQILTGLIALVGVVVVSKPKFILNILEPENIGLVNYNGIGLAVVAAISTAFGMIMLRKLKGTSVHVVVFWFSIVTAVSAGITLYFVDRFVRPADFVTWCWLLGIGLCGIGDQLFMTIAFKHENAGVISVSRMMTIVLAFIWDTLLLDVMIHWTSVLGSCLVTASVILLTISKSSSDEPNFCTRMWRKMNYRHEKGSIGERAKLLNQNV